MIGAQKTLPLCAASQREKGWLRSSRKASKRIYDTATIVALKGRGPEREPQSARRLERLER